MIYVNMKNYPTKTKKIYLITYVLNILSLPIYTLIVKNKEYETELVSPKAFQLSII